MPTETQNPTHPTEVLPSVDATDPSQTVEMLAVRGPEETLALEGLSGWVHEHRKARLDTLKRAQNFYKQLSQYALAEATPGYSYSASEPVSYPRPANLWQRHRERQAVSRAKRLAPIAQELEQIKAATAYLETTPHRVTVTRQWKARQESSLRRQFKNGGINRFEYERAKQKLANQVFRPDEAPRPKTKHTSKLELEALGLLKPMERMATSGLLARRRNAKLEKLNNRIALQERRAEQKFLQEQQRREADRLARQTAAAEERPTVLYDQDQDDATF